MSRKILLTTHEGVVERLKQLHDEFRLTWAEVSATDEFRPIPAGTLCTICKTGIIPKCWRKRLLPSTPTARVSIRKDDMVSAAHTLRNNLSPEKLDELMRILIHHAVVQVERLTEEFGWLGPWEEDETMANFATGEEVVA